MKEILKEIINKLYDIENCFGDWNPECEDILSRSCIACCRGRKLLAQLEQVKSKEPKQEFIRKIVKRIK